WLAVEPAVALTPDTHYKLTLARDLPGAGGTLGMASAQDVAFHTYGPLKFVSISSDQISPDGELDVQFSSPVDMATLRQHIKFAPPLKVDAVKSDNDFETSQGLALSWKPATRYTMTIDADLVDQFGQKLGTAVTQKFKVGHYAPWLDAKDGLWAMEAELPHNYVIGLVNLPKLLLAEKYISRDNLIPALQGTQQEPATLIPHPVPGSVKADTVVWKNVNLDATLGAHKTGAVLVEAADPVGDDDLPVNHTLVQVTHLGITFKTSAESSLVWVTRLEDGKPAGVCEVELRSDQNKVVWHGKTDQNGVCTGPGWDALGLKPDNRWSTPSLFAIASQGDDYVMAQSEGVDLYTFDSVYVDTQYRPTDKQIMVFTERGIYRAGEEVQIKGMVRQEHNADWTVVANAQFQLKVQDARDRKVMTQTVTTNKWGGFNLTCPLRSDAATGTYSIAVSEADNERVGGYQTFQVEAYRPVTYDVKVDAPQAHYHMGDRLQASIDSHYLFGAPVQDSPVKWRAYLMPWDGSFPGYEDWSFGADPWLDQTSTDFDWSQGEPQPVMVAEGQGTLSLDGKYAATANLRPQGVNRNMTMTVEATVQAPGRAFVSGRKSFDFFCGDYSLGAKLSSGFQSTQDTELLQVVALNADGKPQSGARVKVRFVHREWDSVRHGMDWESTPKDTEAQNSEVTTTEQPVTVDFKPQDPGMYYVELTSSDAHNNAIRTTTEFWTYGDGYVAWSREAGDKINMVPDKRQYKPGDVAHIMVQSPYEHAFALITTERELVMSSRIQEIKGSASTIDVPLTDREVPNVYVSVVLLQGRTAMDKFDDRGDDMGRPQFKIGLVNLPVDPAGRKLQVAVKTDKTQYGPDDKVTVDVDLKDATGKPVQGEVTLAAVDLGVLKLINYQTPDPWTFFYANRPLSVALSDTRSTVLGLRRPGEKGNPGGGGGGDQSAFMDVRRNFKTTPYWNPSLVTDAQGHAEISFTLPENLTTFRIMAVASTTTLFGSTQSDIVVNKPLMMTQAMPRFVMAGDTFEGGVVLTNGSDSPESVQVHCNAQGLTLNGDADKTITVGAKGTQEVRFNFTTPQLQVTQREPLPTTVTFQATAGTQHDGVEVTVPITPLRLKESVATSGTTDGNATEQVEVPSEVVPGTSSLQIGLASTALSNVRPALLGLVHYPYGCLEQRLSRIFPMVEGRHLAASMNVSEFEGAKADAIVKDFMQRLPRYQRPSGAMCLWGDPHELDNPYVSCYCLIVLYKAQQAGYQIPAQTLSRLKEYVATVPTLNFWGFPYDKDEELETRCLAVYAMSLWHGDEDSAFDSLYEQRKAISNFGQALLVRTMAKSARHKPQVEDILRHLEQGVRLDPESGYFDGHDSGGWTYESPAVSTAMVLSAELEAGHTTIAPQIMAWLLHHSEGGCYRTTQENAWVLDACNAYLNVMEKAVPNFKADVALDGQPLGTHDFQGRDSTHAQIVHLLADNQKQQTLPLTFTRTGQGLLYYNVHLSYAPKDPRAWAMDQGLSVDKEIAPVDGSPLTEIKAGQVYRVTITVVTPHRRSWVVVDDPLPAGMEIVNTEFDTESDLMGQQLQRIREKQDRQDGSWWTFNHWESYDDKMLLFADWMSPGAHRFTYLVRAMYPGRYLMSTTHAEAMYEPEIFGNTPGRMVTVSP
ncbi:MAG: alpha-2-macroglobulin family protein, partial [Candidatus Xenobia bacterium]